MSQEKDGRSIRKNTGIKGKSFKAKREMSVNSGTVKRRQIMHDIIKTEIFNAVADVMEKRNWSVISIDEIANEIGGSRGTIYHYFRTKSELMSALWLHLHRKMTDVLAPIYHDAELDPVEKLRKYIYLYVYLLCENWRLARVIWTNANHIIRWDNQTSQELLEERMSAIIAMRKMIAAVRPGSQYPKEVLETEARATLAYLDTAIIWYRVANQMTADEAARMVTNTMMNGLMSGWR